MWRWSVSLLALAGAAAAAPAPTPCAVQGTWVDRVGNVAALEVAPDGTTIAATSVYGGTRWRTASGAVQPDGSVRLTFEAGNTQTGAFSTNCSTLRWDGSTSSVWSYAGPATRPAVSQVHLVFMAHLDLGYTDTMRGVCDAYFTGILPACLALAAQTRGSPTPFAHTSHPWLLREYLDGAAGCASARPNASAVAAMEAALGSGAMRWHAQTANLQPELMDAPSFDAQLGDARALGARFGQRWGRLLMKSTDVAGLSVGVVPRLAAAGVRALHMGVNAKITPPVVPQAFTWVHPASGASVLALSSNDYGGVFVVPPHALVVSYVGDNSPPPDAAGVAAVYAAAAARFPGAAVALSSLDDFVGNVTAGPAPPAAALPTVAGEVGDSWLYGAGGDPGRMAAYRETVRTVADAVAGRLGAAPPLDPDDPNLDAFRRRIAAGGPEHNGGLSVGAYLPQSRGAGGNWSNALFHGLLAGGDPAYAVMQAAYDEKRAFLRPLPPAAPPSAAWERFLAARQARVDDGVLAPAPPDVGPGSGFTPVGDPSAPLPCGGARLAVSFNASDGSLARLVDVATGHDWAGGTAAAGTRGGLLRYTYRTYDEADFTAWNTEYTPACGVPCPNFAKVGMDSAGPASREWAPALTGLWVRPGGGAPGAPACTAVAALALPPDAVADYGAPAALWLQVDVDAGPASAPPQLGATLTWVNKTASRLAEAHWLSWTLNAATAPAPAPPPSYWVAVLNSTVDPLNVVPYGTRWLHATDPLAGTPGGPPGSFGASAPPGGAGWARGYAVTSVDAMLVAPGDRGHLLVLDGDGPGPEVGAGGGWHVNLANNLWGTSFAQWYGQQAGSGGAAFRFAATLEV